MDLNRDRYQYLSLYSEENWFRGHVWNTLKVFNTAVIQMALQDHLLSAHLTFLSGTSDSQ